MKNILNYIIHSKQLNKYYVGETTDVTSRVIQHNTGIFKGAFTSATKDWQLRWTLECSDITQTRKIEKHIKSMKSRKYIQNLMNSTDIAARLLKRFPSL